MQTTTSRYSNYFGDDCTTGGGGTGRFDPPGVGEVSRRLASLLSPTSSFASASGLASGPPPSSTDYRRSPLARYGGSVSVGTLQGIRNSRRPSTTQID